MRLRLLAALVVGMLLALPMVLVTSSPAYACRCAASGLGQQARAADVVVAGTVLETRGQGPRTTGRGQGQGQGRGQDGARSDPRFGNVTLVVGVDRIYAGRVPDATIEVTTARQTSACGLGRLDPDQRYFFFLTEDSRVLRATSCNGTGPATEQQTEAITAALGDGRPVDAEEPSTAVQRTLVGEREPISLTAAAAPGGVLAAAGLIGLLLLGGLGRRSRP